MANEETSYMSGSFKSGSFQSSKPEEKLTTSQGSNNKMWAAVSIAGTAGILMGSAGTLAAEKIIKEKDLFHLNNGDNGEADAVGATEGTEENTPQVDGKNDTQSNQENAGETPQTTEGQSGDGDQIDGVNGLAQTDGHIPVADINDNSSFAQAFSAAREQVGPGGVFVWHGHVYNTYTAEEWNSMTPTEHAEFGGHLHIVYDEPAITEVHVAATEPTIIEVTPGGTDYTGEGNADPVLVMNPEPIEPDVRILGVEHTEDEDGNPIVVGAVQDGDDIVGFVDVDNDGIFDVAIHDDNGDGEISQDEQHELDEPMSVSEMQEQFEMQQQQDDYGDGLLYASNGNDIQDFDNNADILV